MFAFFFADSEATGVRGSVSRICTDRVPSALSSATKAVLGDRVHSFILSCVDYTFRQRNPILQVMPAF